MSITREASNSRYSVHDPIQDLTQCGLGSSSSSSSSSHPVPTPWSDHHTLSGYWEQSLDLIPNVITYKVSFTVSNVENLKYGNFEVIAKTPHGNRTLAQTVIGHNGYYEVIIAPPQRNITFIWEALASRMDVSQVFVRHWGVISDSSSSSSSKRSSSSSSSSKRSSSSSSSSSEWWPTSSSSNWG